MTLDEVAEVVEEIHQIEEEDEEEPIGLWVLGGVHAQNISIDYTLWCSEWDGREWDKEKSELEPLKEYLLKELELYAKYILKVVENARKKVLDKPEV